MDDLRRFSIPGDIAKQCSFFFLNGFVTYKKHKCMEITIIMNMLDF